MLEQFRLAHPPLKKFSLDEPELTEIEYQSPVPAPSPDSYQMSDSNYDDGARMMSIAHNKTSLLFSHFVVTHLAQSIIKMARSILIELNRLSVDFAPLTFLSLISLEMRLMQAKASFVACDYYAGWYSVDCYIFRFFSVCRCQP